MKVVILAGGKGRRMCSESTRLPKPLVTVGGIPILCHVIDCFRQHGADEFVVALGFEPEMIVTAIEEQMSERFSLSTSKKSGVSTIEAIDGGFSVVMVDTGLETATGGRLRNIQDYLAKERFALAWCDGLSDLDFQAMGTFHEAHGKIATIAAVHPRSRFGILDLAGDTVCGFIEKPVMTDRWVNGGIALLEPEVFQFIQGDLEQWENEPVHRLMEQGQLMAWKHEGNWQCMDTLTDQEYLESLWRANRAFWCREKNR